MFFVMHQLDPTIPSLSAVKKMILPGLTLPSKVGVFCESVCKFAVGIHLLLLVKVTKV